MTPVPESPEIIEGTVYDNYWLSSPTLMLSVSNDNNNNDNNNKNENNGKGSLRQLEYPNIQLNHWRVVIYLSQE